MPKLYGQEGKEDPLVYAVLSNVRLAWHWYLLEHDPQTRECFAFVSGFADEYGYVWLTELEQNGCFMLKLDLPKPLSEVRSLCELDEAA